MTSDLKYLETYARIMPERINFFLKSLQEKFDLEQKILYRVRGTKEYAGLDLQALLLEMKNFLGESNKNIPKSKPTLRYMVWHILKSAGFCADELLDIGKRLGNEISKRDLPKEKAVKLSSALNVFIQNMRSVSLRLRAEFAAWEDLYARQISIINLMLNNPEYASVHKKQYIPLLREEGEKLKSWDAIAKDFSAGIKNNIQELQPLITEIINEVSGAKELKEGIKEPKEEIEKRRTGMKILLTSLGLVTFTGLAIISPLAASTIAVLGIFGAIGVGYILNPEVITEENADGLRRALIINYFLTPKD